MPKRKNEDTKEAWFRKVVESLGCEHAEQGSYNFITHENITNVFEKLLKEKGLRLTSFNPTRQEYLDEICKFISPTYDVLTGRIIQTNTAPNLHNEIMLENLGEEELDSSEYEKIVTLYFTKTGKTTTEFWKELDKAYNSKVNAAKQSIMQVDIISTTY